MKLDFLSVSLGGALVALGGVLAIAAALLSPFAQDGGYTSKEDATQFTYPEPLADLAPSLTFPEPSLTFPEPSTAFEFHNDGMTQVWGPNGSAIYHDGSILCFRDGLLYHRDGTLYNDNGILYREAGALSPLWVAPYAYAWSVTSDDKLWWPTGWWSTGACSSFSFEES